jgi:tetratricopeptide (TPR) repeat protein
MTYMYAHSNTLERALSLIDSGQEMVADDFLVAQKQEALSKFGKDSKQYGTALYEHAYALISAGSPDEAINVLHELLEIFTAGHLDDPILLSRARYRLGILYMDDGRLLGAEQLLRDCATVRKQSLGETHPEYLACILELAHIQILNGSPQAASKYLNPCLIGFRQIKDSLFWEALALKIVADQNDKVSTPELNIVKEIDVSDIACLLEPFCARLQTFSNQLRLKALELLVNTVADLRNVPIGVRFEYFFQALTEARACMDLPAAEQLARQMIRMAKKEDSAIEEVVALTTLSNVYFQFEVPDKADQAIRNALHLAKEKAPHLVASVLVDWARLMDLCLDMTSALELCHQALTVAQKQADAKSEIAARITCGVLQFHKGEAKEAKQTFASLRSQFELAEEEIAIIQMHSEHADNGIWCACFGDVDRLALHEEIVDRIDKNGDFKKLIATVHFSETAGVDIQLLAKPTQAQAQIMDTISVSFMKEISERRMQVTLDRIRQYR